MKNNPIDKIAYVLLVIGGLNWGLVGLFKYNLVDKIFGVESAISRIIYVLVGIAALYGVFAIISMLAKGKEA